MTGDDFLENAAPFRDSFADVRFAIAGGLHTNWFPHDDFVTPAAYSRDEKRIDRRLRDERKDKRTGWHDRLTVLDVSAPRAGGTGC